MVDKKLEKYVTNIFNSEFYNFNWITYQIVKVTSKVGDEFTFVKYLDSIIVFENDKYIKTIKN